ncbi:hypothetical protein BT67DRAFT_214771 [Trichocladium antarcticum]|uniref:Uncharacterized protein n=1 Tax=Trichocladium antarcticum TaxID=1450529 RepID=A0AAN6Z982_9PEZI|nr:hypothetical protein BT67DRAFT_214771 [Trichocladium antarcticum]
MVTAQPPHTGSVGSHYLSAPNMAKPRHLRVHTEPVLPEEPCILQCSVFIVGDRRPTTLIYSMARFRPISIILLNLLWQSGTMVAILDEPTQGFRGRLVLA